MTDQQLRQTAYKVWISDLMNKEVKKEEGEWSPNYISIDNKQVSRVNIIATVVMKYISEDKGYANLTIDDSSGDIQVKAWKEDISLFESVEIGDPILMIGKIKEYNSQIYLTPEIVKTLDKPEWIELRKKELSNLYGQREIQEPKIQQQPESIAQPKVTEETIVVTEESVTNEEPVDNNRQKLLTLIENLDKGEGSDIVEVVEESKMDEQEANIIIQELLKEGEIFEIKSGKLKIIE
jgi:RPA family protein